MGDPGRRTDGSGGDGGYGAQGGTGLAGSGGFGAGSPVGGADGAGGAVIATCGDGDVDPSEDCDGVDLGGASCTSLLGPFAEGALGCSASCHFDTSACCVPDCAGKSCGSDGCSGSCGVCGGGETCVGGQCACVPDCAGKTCGPDGCGGTCGSCFGSDVCSGGVCQCAPDCSGKDCGPDGCGGTCGSCSGSDVCSAGQCVCVPDCAGKSCGSNGCGGSCGSCSGAEQCSAGQCVCPPSCVGQQCGFDGNGYDSCGALCGACSGNTTCESDLCVACNDACESLVPVNLPPNTVGCMPTGNDCGDCGGPACGPLHYAYNCAGTAVNGVYPPPEIPGCMRRSGTANGYCCPSASCIAYPGANASCQAGTGKPVGRICHDEAQLPPDCILYFANVACCSS